MTITKFYDESHEVTRRLAITRDRACKTMEILGRLCHNEEVNISEWGVRAGKIYITFDACAELEHLPENEMYVPETLKALFPTCRISGTLIEIESRELL